MCASTGGATGCGHYTIALPPFNLLLLRRLLKFLDRPVLNEPVPGDGFSAPATAIFRTCRSARQAGRFMASLFLSNTSSQAVCVALIVRSHEF
jgi:hypothetical protein